MVIAVITEGKAENLGGELEANGVSLCLHQESKWSIIDVICDWYVKRLDLLGAEDDVETSFLTWGNHLA